MNTAERYVGLVDTSAEKQGQGRRDPTASYIEKKSSDVGKQNAVDDVGDDPGFRFNDPDFEEDDAFAIANQHLRRVPPHDDRIEDDNGGGANVVARRRIPRAITDGTMDRMRGGTAPRRDDAMALRSLEEALSKICTQHGRPPKARVDVLEQITTLKARMFGSHSSATRKSLRETVIALNSLAMFALGCSDTSNCKELLARAFDLASDTRLELEVHDEGCFSRMSVDGSKHALRVLTLNNTACLHRRLGEPKRALRLLKRAAEIGRKSSGNEHLEVTHLNACAVLSELGRHEEALEHARSAVFYGQEREDVSSSRIDTDRIRGGGGGTGGVRSRRARLATLAVSYYNLAVELEYTRRFESCLRWYHEAVKLARDPDVQNEELIKTFQRSYAMARKKHAPCTRKAVHADEQIRADASPTRGSEEGHSNHSDITGGLGYTNIRARTHSLTPIEPECYDMASGVGKSGSSGRVRFTNESRVPEPGAAGTQQRPHQERLSYQEHHQHYGHRHWEWPCLGRVERQRAGDERRSKTMVSKRPGGENASDTNNHASSAPVLSRVVLPGKSEGRNHEMLAQHERPRRRHQDHLSDLTDARQNKRAPCGTTPRYSGGPLSGCTGEDGKLTRSWSANGFRGGSESAYHAGVWRRELPQRRKRPASAEVMTKRSQGNDVQVNRVPFLASATTGENTLGSLAEPSWQPLGDVNGTIRDLSNESRRRQSANSSGRLQRRPACDGRPKSACPRLEDGGRQDYQISAGEAGNRRTEGSTRVGGGGGEGEGDDHYIRIGRVRSRSACTLKHPTARSKLSTDGVGKSRKERSGDFGVLVQRSERLRTPRLRMESGRESGGVSMMKTRQTRTDSAADTAGTASLCARTGRPKMSRSNGCVNRANRRKANDSHVIEKPLDLLADPPPRRVRRSMAGRQQNLAGTLGDDDSDSCLRQRSLPDPHEATVTTTNDAADGNQEPITRRESRFDNGRDGKLYLESESILLEGQVTPSVTQSMETKHNGSEWLPRRDSTENEMSMFAGTVWEAVVSAAVNQRAKPSAATPNQRQMLFPRGEDGQVNIGADECGDAYDEGQPVGGVRPTTDDNEVSKTTSDDATSSKTEAHLRVTGDRNGRSDANGITDADQELANVQLQRRNLGRAAIDRRILAGSTIRAWIAHAFLTQRSRQRRGQVFKASWEREIRRIAATHIQAAVRQASGRRAYKRMVWAVAKIQRVIRGRHGRLEGTRLVKERTDKHRAASKNIQRLFRGYGGRQRAWRKKQIRREEEAVHQGAASVLQSSWRRRRYDRVLRPELEHVRIHGGKAGASPRQHEPLSTSHGYSHGYQLSSQALTLQEEVHLAAGRTAQPPAPSTQSDSPSQSKGSRHLQDDDAALRTLSGAFICLMTTVATRRTVRIAISNTLIAIAAATLADFNRNHNGELNETVDDTLLSAPLSLREGIALEFSRVGHASDDVFPTFEGDMAVAGWRLSRAERTHASSVAAFGDAMGRLICTPDKIDDKAHCKEMRQDVTEATVSQAELLVLEASERWEKLLCLDGGMSAARDQGTRIERLTTMMSQALQELFSDLAGINALTLSIHRLSDGRTHHPDDRGGSLPACDKSSSTHGSHEALRRALPPAIVETLACSAAASLVSDPDIVDICGIDHRKCSADAGVSARNGCESPYGRREDYCRLVSEVFRLLLISFGISYDRRKYKNRQRCVAKNKCRRSNSSTPSKSSPDRPRDTHVEACGVRPGADLRPGNPDHLSSPVTTLTSSPPWNPSIRPEDRLRLLRSVGDIVDDAVDALMCGKVVALLRPKAQPQHCLREGEEDRIGGNNNGDCNESNPGSMLPPSSPSGSMGWYNHTIWRMRNCLWELARGTLSAAVDESDTVLDEGSREVTVCAECAACRIQEWWRWRLQHRRGTEGR